MSTCPHGKMIPEGGPFRYGHCYECWCEQNPAMCRQSVRSSRRVVLERQFTSGRPPQAIPEQQRSVARGKRESRVVVPLPCIYVGATLPPPDSKPTNKVYHSCDHEYPPEDEKYPGFPAGKPVCWCTGCGPECKGYVADTEAEPEPIDFDEKVKATIEAQTYMRPGSPLKERVNGTYPLIWSYGVTTVPSRRDTTLPRTLSSLAAGGFDKPHLFVDGGIDSDSWALEFGLDVTMRTVRVKAFGNWVLTLWEIFLLNPWADRYAVFQDDFITCRNLRGYLDATTYPGETVPTAARGRRTQFDPKIVRHRTDLKTRGYLNLYTFPSNQKLVPESQLGFFRSNQFGRGAVALVFNREAVISLLATEHMCERPIDKGRGHKSVDGAIVTALAKAGWVEYCHNPSLVQHIGDVSSIGNRKHLQAVSFRGEEFDALSLLAQPVGS